MTPEEKRAERWERAGCQIGCVAVIFVLYLLVQGVTPWVFDWHYKMGEKHHRNGEHEAAIAYLDQAIQNDPDHSNAHYYRGITRGILGDTGGAVADLNRALKLGLDRFKTSWTYYNLGIAMAQMKQFSPAVHYYEKAMNARPWRPLPMEFYYSRGVALINLGRIRNAEDDGQVVLSSFLGRDRHSRHHFVCSVRNKFRSRGFCIKGYPFVPQRSRYHRYQCISPVPETDEAPAQPDVTFGFLDSDIDCSQ